jgi:hypothetical protein
MDVGFLIPMITAEEEVECSQIRRRARQSARKEGEE